MLLKPGDIIFEFNKWSMVDEAIAFFTFPILYNGELHHLSHAEIITEVIDDDNVWVISADASGLNLEQNKLSDIPFWIAKTCPVLTDLQRSEIIRSAIAHKGVKYNFLGLLDYPLQFFNINVEQKHALYCSQSVYDFYLLQADDFFRDPACEGIWLLSDVPYVSPAHLFTSPDLKKITGIYGKEIR